MMPSLRTFVLAVTIPVAAIGVSLAAGRATSPDLDSGSPQASGATAVAAGTDDGAARSSADDPGTPEDNGGGADRSGPRKSGIELPEAAGTGSEVPGSTGGLPGLGSRGRHGDPASRPLVTQSVRDAGTRTGGLVAGYPEDLLPLAPGSRDVVSSVSPGDGRLQAAVVATQRRSAEDVLRFYRLHLARWGFTEVRSQVADSSSAAAFRRAGSTITVTVAGAESPAQEKTTTYSVYAVLRVRGT